MTAMSHSEVSRNQILGDLIADLGPKDARAVALQTQDADEGISHLLASLLADMSISPRIAYRVLWLLPSFPTEELIGQALRTMADRPDLAHAAGRELKKLKDPSIIPRLGSMVLDSTLATDSRAEAAVVLGELGDPAGKDFLVRALKALQEPIVLRAAAYSLGYIQLLEGSTDAADDLCILLSSSFPEVRLAAVNALSNMWATQARDQIEALVNDQGVTASGENVGKRAAEVSRLLRDAQKDR